MIKKVFTVGHSTHDLETFIKLIETNKINCIVDVRSTPYSQYAPQFNEKEIKHELNKRGIIYIYMGKELGARRNDDSLYINGKLSFEKTKESSLFKQGINRLNKGLEKGYTIALMCSEKKPMDCHRCIMIGKYLADEGYEVNHILEDSSIITQQEIDIDLLDSYFPDRDQISLFVSENKAFENYVAEAYELKEGEIAFDRTSAKHDGEI